MRFEDSPELFGGGAGMSTTGSVHCQFCGETYEDTADIQSVVFTTFAGLQVCHCCFEKIEGEILCRMQDILPWFSRILASRRKRTDALQELLNSVKDAILRNEQVTP